MRRLLVFIIMVLCMSANAKKIELHEKTLENGLKILVIPLKTNKVIRVGVVYKVGCADDQQSKVGLSHFLEHMMFKGTKNLSGERLKHFLDKYNSFTNAATGDDVTFYYYTLNKEYLDVNLVIEADRMQNLLLDASEIEREKKVVMEERQMRCDADPRTRHICDAVPRSLYLHSSYGANLIGHPNHIQSYSRSALQRHYNKYYTPSNAMIIIAGDISVEEAVTKVTSAFGNIKRTHDVVRKRPIDPKDTGIKHSIDRTSNQVTAKELTLVYSFERENVDSLKKYYTAKILIEMLCGTSRSIAYKKLVDSEEKLYSIDGSIVVRAVDKAFVFIECNLREETNDKEIEQEVVQVIDDFKNVDQAVFAKIKNKILNSIDFLMDDPAEMFMFFLDHTVCEYSIDDISNVREIINSITFEDVIGLAQTILTEKNRTHRFYSHPE